MLSHQDVLEVGDADVRERRSCDGHQLPPVNHVRRETFLKYIIDDSAGFKKGERVVSVHFKGLNICILATFG